MYPKLIRGAKAPARVVLWCAETTDDGTKRILCDRSVLGNFQGAAQAVKYGKDRERAMASGILLMDGDVTAGSVGLISGGEVTISGIAYAVNRVTFCRNPDGSINYTRIEVE